MNTSTAEIARPPVRAIYPLSLTVIALLALGAGTLLYRGQASTAQPPRMITRHVPYFDAHGPLFERQISFAEAGRSSRSLAYASTLPAAELIARYEAFARDAGCTARHSPAPGMLRADCDIAGLGELRVDVRSHPGLREVEVGWRSRASSREYGGRTTRNVAAY